MIPSGLGVPWALTRTEALASTSSVTHIVRLNFIVITSSNLHPAIPFVSVDLTKTSAVVLCRSILHQIPTNARKPLSGACKRATFGKP